jgi:hypothetical protein
MVGAAYWGCPYLSQQRPEFLAEFQRIAEMDKLAA